jgi:hypothetical protein
VSERYIDEMDAVEQVCFLASMDGGRVDLRRPRSQRAAAKIDAALRAGAIDGQGHLTATGWRMAEQ